MIQQETESIKEFETRLTSQAKKCNFTVPSIEIPAVPGTRNEPGTPAIPVQFKDVSEEMIRDRIVVGIQNKSIQRRLLRERERERFVSLSAVNMLKAIETANQQAKTYLNLGHTPAGVDAIQSTEGKFKAHSSSKPQIRLYSKPQAEKCNLQHERCRL